MKKIIFLTLLICGFILQTQAQRNSDSSKLYNIVYQMPMFPGGEQALYKYISDNLHYPDSARKNNIEGIANVKFIVMRNGSVDSVQSSPALGYGLNEEAERVVALMPRWKPARNNGKRVYVHFNIPIRFILQKEEDKKSSD